MNKHLPNMAGFLKEHAYKSIHFPIASQDPVIKRVHDLIMSDSEFNILLRHDDLFDSLDAEKLKKYEDRHPELQMKQIEFEEAGTPEKYDEEMARTIYRNVGRDILNNMAGHMMKYRHQMSRMEEGVVNDLFEKAGWTPEEKNKWKSSMDTFLTKFFKNRKKKGLDKDKQELNEKSEFNIVPANIKKFFDQIAGIGKRNWGIKKEK